MNLCKKLKQVIDQKNCFTTEGFNCSVCPARRSNICTMSQEQLTEEVLALFKSYLENSIHVQPIEWRKITK